jgi:thiamine kinase-like enzyme
MDQSGNILLIDYEYTGWNPMVADISNYFIETMLDNGSNHEIIYNINNCMTI